MLNMTKQQHDLLSLLSQAPEWTTATELIHHLDGGCTLAQMLAKLNRAHRCGIVYKRRENGQVRWKINDSETGINHSGVESGWRIAARSSVIRRESNAGAAISMVLCDGWQWLSVSEISGMANVDESRARRILKRMEQTGSAEMKKMKVDVSCGAYFRSAMIMVYRKAQP